MPFNISEFKSNFKDSLPSNRYEMLISPPGRSGENLRIRTENIMLPGIAFFSVDNYSPYGNGLTYQMPYRYSPQEISVTHTVDQNGEVYQAFREWAGTITDFGGDSKFGAYYFDQYTVNAQINVYNRNDYNTPVIIVNLEDVYPISIDPIQMGWDQADSVAKFSVQYRFVKFAIENNVSISDDARNLNAFGIA